MERGVKVCILGSMLKAFKYRIYPTPKQAELIDKHISASRFIYNLALETKQEAYRKGVALSGFDLQKQIKDLRLDCRWIDDINTQSLYASIMNLEDAYKRFFKGIGDFPRFKKKRTDGSFNVPQWVAIKNGKLSLPKMREGLEINFHRPIIGAIRQATISKTPTGKYFASILCETGEAIPDKKLISPKTTIGIDLGIKSFLVGSDGTDIPNPRHFKKSLSKLKYLQRKASKYRGKRTRLKVARLHEKTANQRKDFLHKTSTMLIKNHDAIAIEDLAVSNLTKNHSLAQAITDSSWSEFNRLLAYKANWSGKNILKIGRFEPSSKTCSNCGSINKDLTLQQREWTCSCGSVLNRDLNAAINIKNFALSAGRRRKNQSELPTLVGAKTSESFG